MHWLTKEPESICHATFLNTRKNETLKMIDLKLSFKPYCILLIFTNEPDWLRASIRALLWPYLRLIFWMRRDSNPQPLNRESNSLTFRPD
jgi:hypothetical protein